MQQPSTTYQLSRWHHVTIHIPRKAEPLLQSSHAPLQRGLLFLGALLYHQAMDAGTIAYYDSNAERYAAATFEAVPDKAREMFLGYLGKGSAILDLGCGSGRDSMEFLSRGHRVTAVDGSSEMCRIASENTGLDVRCMLFSELDFVDAFDGVWACASLLHAKRNDLRHIMELVHGALRKDGIFYFSFKEGSGEAEVDGRFFTYLSSSDAMALIDGLFSPEMLWISPDANPSRHDTSWLNAIVRKA